MYHSGNADQGSFLHILFGYPLSVWRLSFIVKRLLFGVCRDGADLQSVPYLVAIFSNTDYKSAPSQLTAKRSFQTSLDLFDEV
jgi:hypothetical protein